MVVKTGSFWLYSVVKLAGAVGVLVLKTKYFDECIVRACSCNGAVYCEKWNIGWC